MENTIDRVNTTDLLGSIQILQCYKCDLLSKECFTLFSENRCHKAEKKKDEELIFELVEQCDKLQCEIEKFQKQQDEIILAYEDEKLIFIRQKNEFKLKISELLDYKARCEKFEQIYTSAFIRQSDKEANLQSIQAMLISACEFYSHNYTTFHGKYWRCIRCQDNCHGSDIYKHCLKCMKIKN